MRVGQSLVLKNSEDHLVNPNLVGRGLEVNPLLGSGESFNVAVDNQDVLPAMVSCNIHPWMRARLLVRRDPYFAISKPDGTFEISKLPAGDLEFVVYHERSGHVEKAELNGKKVEWPRGSMKVTVKTGQATDLGDVKLPAKQFNKQ
jgi:hypothetical protein